MFKIAGGRKTEKCRGGSAENHRPHFFHPDLPQTPPGCYAARMRPLRACHWLLALTLGGTALGAPEELPQRAAGERAEAEPGLMLDDLPNLTPEDVVDAPPPGNVELARVELARARSKQQRWQKLARAGVLSRVEAESAVLQVARALMNYQTALAAQSATHVAQLRAARERGASSAEELAAAEAVQQTSAALAADATADWQRQLRQNAAAHLDRQRRLRALGLTSPAQLRRAAAAVEKLHVPPAPAARQP